MHQAYIVKVADIAYNIHQLQAWAGPTPIWAVLKGDGYGLGIKKMTEICWENGVNRFAVTEFSEAKMIREIVGPNAKILMLHPVTHYAELLHLANLVTDLGVIFTLSSEVDAKILDRLQLPVEVHLKVDTGMGRHGFLPTEADLVCKILSTVKYLMVSGVYTHFPAASLKESRTRGQFKQFQDFCSGIEASGYPLGERHCCNTAAFLRFPDMHLQGVRIGSGLFGRVLGSSPVDLQQVGWVEAEIEEIRQLPKYHTIGYGAAVTLKRDTRCAFLPIGYYHGYLLQRGRDIWRVQDCLRGILSNLALTFNPNRPMIRIGKNFAPVLGHIGMLHTCVDVTDIPCVIGDIARLEMNPLYRKCFPVIYR